MPVYIDGAIDVGAVSVGSIALDPGTNLIGRVVIEDGGSIGASSVFADVTGSVLSTTGGGEAPGTVSDSGSIGVTNAGPPTQLRPATINRKLYTVTNPENSDVNNILYIGDSSVAVGEGIPVYPGETYEDTETGQAWYGIFAVTGLTVPYHEVTTT